MQPASTVMVRLSVSTLRTAFMRVRLSTICVPDASGVEPTGQPGVAALRHDGGARSRAGLDHRCHFGRAGRAHHSQGLAAHAAAPVLFPGGEVAFGQYMGIATMERRVSSKEVMAERLQDR